jgi:hypothetical protein
VKPTRSGHSNCTDSTPQAKNLATVQLVAALVWAHEETVKLVRWLLLTQEAADNRRAESERAIDLILTNPGDPSALSRLAIAADRAAAAERDELKATEDWWAHILDVQGLIAVAEDLNLVPETDPVGVSAEAAPRRMPPGRATHRRGKCSARSH